MSKFKFNFKNNLGSRDQIYFIDRLKFLLSSGVPILESLSIIENQTKNKNKRKIYRDISEKISRGHSLSEATRSILNDFAFNMILNGEQSGFLASNLGHLSLQLKKRRDLKKKISGALAYPAFVGMITLSMVFFLVFYIFPKILPVLGSLKAELPLTTKIVIFFSNFVLSFWVWGLIGIFIFIGFFIYFFKKHSGFRLLAFKAFLVMPIWKDIYRDFLLANFCHNLNLLQKGGLSIDQSLALTKNSITNTFLSSKISEMEILVLKGGQMSDYLFSQSKIFSEDFAGLIAVGERTGNLENIFESSADFYEERFSEKVKNLSQMIEPILMITSGLVVGFVAISIISPIYAITQNL